MMWVLQMLTSFMVGGAMGFFLALLWVGRHEKKGEPDPLEYEADYGVDRHLRDWKE